MRLLLLLLILLAVPLHRGQAQTIVVGNLTLTHCIGAYNGYCGTLVRPLDPAGHVPGTITIGFEFYPHTDTGKPGLGTIIAQEGGPGYSTTGSRDGYVRLFTPLRTGRDILLIDKRGTGRSGAIACRALQHGGGVNATRACGQQLGATAWLYSSAFAADDVAAVLAALNTGPVDYYGDSYATFFGQVFAVRHPDLLRTIVLDSAYPVLGEGPFFRSEIENGVPSFEKTCIRTPACQALGGSAAARFGDLVNALRAHSVTGSAPGPDGTVHTVTADAGALFTIIYQAGNNPSAYRDIDAAGRAWLGQADPVPLLRLVAEAIAASGFSPAHEYSNGLFQAVVCADYQQLYGMNLQERQRGRIYADRLHALGANHPDLFAPFTPAEALGAPTNPEGLDRCAAWPAAPAWATPGQPVPANAVFPKVPVLVLSGEFDTVTSPKEGAWTTALFPEAYFVVIKNSGHEVAVGDGGVWVPPYGGDLAQCAGPLVLHFVATGGDPGDTSCALRVRPIRAVPAFATSWQTVASAQATAGNAADPAGLTLASAVAETVGDAVARYYVTTSNTGGGLRGGLFYLRQTATGYHLRLDKVKWTNDLTVSGTIDWNQITGRIAAMVNFSAPGHSGTVLMAWNDRETNAQAKLIGTVDGANLDATRAAP